MPSNDSKLTGVVVRIAISLVPMGATVYSFAKVRIRDGLLWFAVSILISILSIGGGFIAKVKESLLQILNEEKAPRLARLIATGLESQLKSFWLKVSRRRFKRKYYEHLMFRYRTYRTHGLKTKGPFTLDLEKVYVPLRVSAESPTAISPAMIQTRAVNKGFTMWDFLARTSKDGMMHHHLAVLGSPGSGKTTLLEHLALTYALGNQVKQHRRAPKLIPIILYLRDIRTDITHDSPSLAELVTRQESIQKLSPHPKWFENRLRDGKCLVMLDGLDEVADDAQRKRVSQWVNDQLEDYSANTFILTSRPFGFSSAPVEPTGVVLEVQPFNSIEVERFVHNWYLQNEIMSQVRKEDRGIREEARKKAEDLINRIAASRPLAAMAVNPLLLTMISTVHAIRAVLPGRRVELYAEICDVLLGRRVEAKGIPDTLTSTQKRSVLQVLAFELMKKETRVFTRQTGCSLILNILSAVTSEDKLDPSGFLESIQNVSGLIIEKELDTYEFAHQSFQEYLASVEVKSSNQGDILSENIQNPWWSETIRLYAAQSDATSLIRSALEKPSVVALTVAWDCLEEAAMVMPEVRQELEGSLKIGIESQDPEVARLAAEVRLSLRLNKLVRLSDTVEMDATHVTCAEYQLFINDGLGKDGFRQPDHWLETRFAKGLGSGPVLGVRSSDATKFCEWLTQRYTSSDFVFRIPTSSEIETIPTTEDYAGAWYTDRDRILQVTPTSGDYQAWHELTSVLVSCCLYVLDLRVPEFDFALALELSRYFVLGEEAELSLISPLDFRAKELDVGTDVLSAAILHAKERSDFLFRELDVNAQTPLPLIVELARDLEIDLGLAGNLLERELSYQIAPDDFPVEFRHNLNKAQTLARRIGIAKYVARELSTDLTSALDRVAHSLPLELAGCHFTTRNPNVDYRGDRSILLWNCFATKRELAEIGETEPGGETFVFNEAIVALYASLLLVSQRKSGLSRPWEAIRVTMERQT